MLVWQTCPCNSHQMQLELPDSEAFQEWIAKVVNLL